MILYSFIWPFVCGIANRIRGGWLTNYIKKIYPDWGTDAGRIFVSCIITIPLINQFVWWKILLFNIVLFLGFCPGWDPWNIMKNPKVDIPHLSLRGLILTFPAGFLLGLWPFAFCGILMGTTYYYTWKYAPYYKDCSGYVWSGSDWGELIFGVILGSFLIYSIS